jgi:hypothetical protein
VIVLEKSHKDEAQRAQFGAVQTQLEHQMTFKVHAAKSLNFQRREKLEKMFPKNCPSDASQSGNWRQLAATYWRSDNRADAAGEQLFTMNHNEAQRGKRKQKG